jgi:thiamine pyrophosphokinase
MDDQPASEPGTIDRDAHRRLIDTVVVVTGAAPIDSDAVRSVPHDALLIAADGGLDHALAAGLEPSVVIGDLDSISAAGLTWARQHAEVVRHPPDKDLTDTELAVRYALDLHPARIVLLAGGGDRLDHTLAAIGSMGDPALTAVPRLECLWGGQHVHLLHGPARQSLDVAVGTTISLLALHGACRGVGVHGTRWPLTDMDLAPLSGLGVSNLVTSTPLRLEVREGVLSVFINAAPHLGDTAGSAHRDRSQDQPPTKGDR